ncbi:hypothetical protein HFP71_33985 [Streptomyces sp. ARC32]
MDRAQLIEAAAGRTAPDGKGGVSAEDVERVCDALFGTLEQPGAIAVALKREQSVFLGSFGSFRMNDRDAAFDAGKALAEYLRSAST